ncbi:26S proteasome regulatory subunit 7 [Exophiala xenobiotica]|nr:26S proteasome regulatory subunit 7 [Exophiala xenobiotica]
MFAIRARRKVATEQDFLQSVEKVVSATETLARNPQHIQSFSYHDQRELKVQLHNHISAKKSAALHSPGVRHG